MAVAKGTVISCLRSPPRSAGAERRPPPPPPLRRNCLNRSAKPPAPSSPPPAAEDVVEVERIGLRTGRVGPAWAAARTAGAGRRVEMGIGGAKLVEVLALLGVAEDFERALDFLKLGLGRGVVRVHVRMVLPRELAIGLLDVVGRGVAFDAEGFVGVFGHGEPESAETAIESRGNVPFYPSGGGLCTPLGGGGGAAGRMLKLSVAFGSRRLSRRSRRHEVAG